MTSAASNSTPTITGRSVNPTEVGWQFVPQYYTFVNKQPNRLHCFYTKNSTFSHGTEGEDIKACYGQVEIHNKIMGLGYDNCKVFIHNVDAQSSANNGIIIQVVGEMSNKGEPWKKFVQTFFLAEQPNGYFVLNDLFRFLKEESAGDEEEEEEEAEAEPVQETVTVAAPEPPAAPEPAPIVPIDDVVDSYEPENPTAETATSIDQHEEPEAAKVEEPAINGINGAHHSDKAESVTAEEPEVPAEPEPVAAPEPVTTVREPSPAPPAESTPAPAPPPPVKVPSPAPPAPVAAPAPEKPAGPKTWATLAANNTKKWGSVVSDAKGASVAAAPSPTPSPQPQKNIQRSREASSGVDTGRSAGMQAALSVTTAACFVKSVTENVVEEVMRDALTQRFGPVKELEIVRSKACAFLEFTTVEAARKAIAASLPVPQGGEGGIRLEGKPAGPNNLPPRIIVETRKERGERPPPRPRGGAPIGEGGGRGGMMVGGEGGPRGRGRGGQMGRGGGAGRGGPK